MFKHLSLESLQNLELIDSSLAIQMMNIFLNEFPMHNQLIQNNIQIKNSLEFGRRVHALKGSIAVFGCESLCSEFKKIELLAKSGQFEESLILFNDTQAQLNEFVNEIRQFVSGAKFHSAA